MNYCSPVLRSHITGKPPIISALTDLSLISIFLSNCIKLGIASEAVNATDLEGTTALAILADGRETTERLQLVSSLLAAGASLSGRIDPVAVANAR